jgi:Flp pilus assembly protein TadG
MRSSFLSKLRRLSSDKSGNVTIIFGLALVPALLMVGGAIDYARAGKTRAQLSAIADAAALAAATPNMRAQLYAATTQGALTQASTSAQTAASNMFAAQAATVGGVTYDPSKLTVTVTDALNASGVNTRTATVTYNAKVNTLLGALDWANQTNFTVTATANVQVTTNSVQPNIDFYILADNSPSMELPSTAAGVTTMQNNTGCALACHENNVSDTEYTTHYPGWGSIDSYQYAQNAGITLRIDSVRQAVKDLAQSISTAATANNAAYRMAVYGFNGTVSKIHALSPATSANVTAIKNDVANLTPPLMDSNNNLPNGGVYTYPTSATTYATVTTSSTLNNSDAMTNFDLAMNSMNTIIPTGGTGAAGATPRQVLVLITDGVDDATLFNSTACTVSTQTAISNSYGSFTRCMQPVDTTVCTALKNTGVLIAVLYVKYYPEQNDTFYTTYIAPNLAQVPINLQKCASGQDLFFQVDNDGNFSSALFNTFTAAVAAVPRLTH